MAYPPVKAEEIDFAGGVDMVTPALALPPGCAIASQNYEADLNGGYRRMYGCERFDGQPSPSAQTYWLLEGALTGVITIGNTVTGATSGATGIVLQINGTTELVLTVVVGTFTIETINISGSPVGTITSVNQTGAMTPSQDAVYTKLAANYYRNLILKPPGSGGGLGAKYYNGAVYAFRNNAGGTAAVMWKSTSTGWSQVTFGRSLSFVQRSGTVTITNATPGVVSFTKHGAIAGTPVSFSTTGALPTGLVVGTVYYVIAGGLTANAFEVSATLGGAAVATSSAGSGVHTATFQSAGQVAVGDTITGVTSGATAVVKAALLQSGTWPVSPVGSFVFATVTGAFVTGEALTDTTALVGQAVAADAAITLQPGGRFEFVINNFGGQAITTKLYGCDGVNKCWEFDGTTFVPIPTGIAGDNPQFITAWMNMLVVALGSSVEVSGIGQPYSWTALTGAAELTLGDTCTGLLPQVPNQTTGALAIFTLHRTFMLYGTSVADFTLVTQSPDAGAVPYSMQNIGFAYFLDVKGMMQINTTRNYGNFAMAVLTRKIQPFINANRGKVVASCIVRASNQVRIYYADGTGFSMYMTPQNTETIGGDVLLGDVVGGIMTFDYSAAGGFTMITSDVDTMGIERTFACGANGYVYELERGTSIDGVAIFSYLLTAFNSSKTPRNRKKYKRTTINAKCGNTANVSIGYSLSFGGQESVDGYQAFQTMFGNGSWWDVFTWDQFIWDAPYVNEYTVDMPGNGRNLSLIIYGNTDLDLPYTIQSAIPNYTIGRLERG